MTDDRSSTDFDRGQPRPDTQSASAPVDVSGGLPATISDRGPQEADPHGRSAPVGSSATNGQVHRAPHRSSAVGDTPSSAGAKGRPSPSRQAPRLRTIYDVIAENCERFSTLDDAQVANRVIADVARDWKQMMFPLVVHAVWGHRRAQTRSAEQKSLEAGRRPAKGRPVHVIRHDASDLAVFVSLLNRPLRVGGERTTWGDMTVEQHKVRRELLEKQRHGLARTRDLHDLAIAVCESRGVDSLRPLFNKKGEAA